MQTKVRVPLMTKPERCHQAARRMEGSGGWALVVVDCGMSVAVAEEVERGGDVVAALVPEVGKAKEVSSG